MVLESIVVRQKDALIKLINLNKEANGRSGNSSDIHGLSAAGGVGGSLLQTASNMIQQSEVWKVLVFDKSCRDIIGPLLKVGDLRKNGVTLHLSLDTDRQAIPEVQSIYFVQPTIESICRIVKDASAGLYESITINFSSPIPRPLMEDFALQALQADCIRKIKKIHDQFLNFISLDSSLFSLDQSDVYLSLHAPGATDTHIEQTIDQVVTGLFSVLVTMGTVPVIRAPRGEAAEMVALKLDAKIREHLNSPNSNVFSEHQQHGGAGAPFSSSAGFQRPVLVLTDRSIDMAVNFHHPWSYRAMLHDILDMKSNRVTVDKPKDAAAAGAAAAAEEPAADSKKNKVTYDFEPSDAFFSENAGSPFQTVTERIDAELSQYKVEMEEIKRRTGINAEEMGEMAGAAAGMTKELMALLERVPVLREKKKRIDMHTNVAFSLLGQIKARELDSYFSIEESLLNRSSLDKAAMMQLLTDPAKGTAQDKLRLYMTYLLCTDKPEKAETDRIEEAFRTASIDLGPVNYMKRFKSLSRGLSGFVGGGFGGSSSSMMMEKSVLSDLAGKAKVFGEQVKLFGMGLATGMRSASSMLNMTRVVDSIMEMKASPEFESYLYLDPKLSKQSAEQARQRNKFRDAIVFVVGGGNYVEYQNLLDYSRASSQASDGGITKSILYGSTELINGNAFLSQISKLAELEARPASSSAAGPSS